MWLPELVALAKLVAVHATHDKPSTPRPASLQAHEALVLLEAGALPDSSPRFVALDVHMAYLVIGAVASSQAVVLPARRVSLAQFSDWVSRNLLPTDQVVLETTFNAWAFYDQLVPLVSRVVVAHPSQVKLIAASVVKTDKYDTLVLARLLAANLIPAVWVPPPEVRALRALVAHRQRLLKQRTIAKNRRHEFTPPAHYHHTSH